MRACRKKWLSAEQEAAVRKAYARGATSAEAAFVAGVTVSVIYARLRDQIKDLRRGQGRGGRRGEAVDPTPEEIAIRRAECDQRRLLLMRPKFYDPENLD
jgi:hypothetical protein